MHLKTLLGCYLRRASRWRGEHAQGDTANRNIFLLRGSQTCKYVDLRDQERNESVNDHIWRYTRGNTDASRMAKSLRAFSHKRMYFLASIFRYDNRSLNSNSPAADDSVALIIAAYHKSLANASTRLLPSRIRTSRSTHKYFEDFKLTSIRITTSLLQRKRTGNARRIQFHFLLSGLLDVGVDELKHVWKAPCNDGSHVFG
jgi:hypothetical protein